MKLMLCLMLAISFIFGKFDDEYYDIKNNTTQRQEFVRILKPLIDKANLQIQTERQFIVVFFAKAFLTSFRMLDKDDLKELIFLKNKYRIKLLFNKQEFLKRVDFVPVSLALGQAAIESGWGRSRFVREANNIFGHWTWGEKGLIPKNRDEDKTHKIRIFDTLQDSVNAYFLNLNRHFAYKNFRIKREKYRQKSKKFDGVEAAKTMANYSTKRDEYVNLLSKIILSNKFFYFDAKAYNQR